MSLLPALLFAYQVLVLWYFAILNLLYALFALFGLGMVARYARELSELALKDLLEREAYLPISILVPTYNEEKSIVASVRSFLNLHYPEFEVIVVADGPTDRTLEVLQAAFRLVRVDWVFRRVLPARPIRGVYRSLVHPNLIVVDKENGGKADALNAGLNLARYPLFCAVDADSLLDAQALLRASRLFLEDDRVLAVGGTIRPLNGAVVREGAVEAMRLPHGFLEKMQVLEYARAFFLGRAGWSAMGALLIISGAFGLFRREAVLRAGGYRADTVGEDMELVVRLHRRAREEGRPYRILYTPDPICYTEVPSDWKTLRRQRNRWHRGLWEVLWRHRAMLFNPRYGRLGFVAMPYFLLFEALAPVVEVLGYLLLPVLYLLGLLSAEFALLFLLLAVGYGVLLSQLGVGMETLLLKRYPRLSDRLALLFLALLEALGYRQLLALERFLATFQVWRKRGVWGEMRRKGLEGDRQGP
ncbi:glycosyltransferase family 2 protein [Thermus thermamylovorans]|uniref:Glycosyltransferase family 2 protein n=1 Tax=Thermus thermamylovorans TaxID=2509362 RepID=A0A4Q9B4E5_9DEIN|nr:glycosyltransferase family 2 protein [Thermus thermamylovorans]TBH20189.1 glycosyltransferase family 2 protein [Thermus thermamylovorans]